MNHVEDDDPRDAHLMAALRHAPDRDATPPREVSERILAAARAAVRPERETRAPGWRQLRAWLMRPQVAASFGTLVVAALVGVMWSTREPPVAELVTDAPLAGGVDQRPMAPASVVSAPSEAAHPDTGGPAAASAGGADARDRLAVAPPPKAVGEDAATRAESRARAKAERPAAPEAPTATAAAPTPAAEASPPSPAAAPPALPSADAAAPRRRSANESDAPILARQQGAASARSAPAVAAELSLAAKARSAEPLAAIDAALAAGARWQVATGTVPHGPAQRAFWASVDEATRGRWEAVPDAVPPAPWLVLEPGSSGGAVFWIANGALHLNAEGRSWRAPVDAVRLADWQERLERW
jgi:hypothetical protein